MKKLNQNVTILYPGGNTTAIIDGISSSQLKRKRVNDAIMGQFPEVEQVGFLDRSEPRLQMAGGEFCGNATRCAAYLLLSGKSGKISLSVSGAGNKKLKAWIDKSSLIWAQMPLPPKLKIKTTGKFQIVYLSGITQVVTPLPKFKNSPDELKQQGHEFRSLT